MANDGWAVVKGLRELGVDADLFVARPDHVGSLPQWEEAKIDLSRIGNAYDPNWEVLNENWSMPKYLHVWNMRRPWHADSLGYKLGWIAWRYLGIVYWSRPVKPLRKVRMLQANLESRDSSNAERAESATHALSLRANLLRLWARLGERGEEKEIWHRLHEYDLVIGHVPFADFASIYRRVIGKPYVLYDAGWIHYLHEKTYPSYDMWESARRGYRNAAAILMSNVDTLDIFKKNGYDLNRIFYTPFAIDTRLYKPMLEERQSQEPVFFQPSRPEKLKASDNFLHAFARYIKRKPNAKLWLVDWGRRQPNWHEHLQLTSELGIADNITWMPVMNKRPLIEYYNMATVVVDQFGTGGLGTLTPEALSCGKPVIAYANRDMWMSVHGSVPPVANARSPDEIYDAMVRLEDQSERKRLGSAGRKWVEETSSLEVVARLQLTVYEKVVSSDI
jgi:glycosyltransferase involved in cell wall biosynthesis